MSEHNQNLLRQIVATTAWLRGEMDMPASRIALLLRRRGVDPRTVICVKVFPDAKDPVNGMIITPQKRIFYFTYNMEGMTDPLAQFDHWHDLTSTFMEHAWRDEALAGLAMLDAERNR